MHGPAFGGFRQFGYVTTDLDRAIDLFAQRYGFPTFARFKGKRGVEYRGEAAMLDLSFALADFDGGQIELIQPNPGCVALYSDGLPDGGFGLHLHHVAMPFDGDAARWDGFEAELTAAGRKLAMQVRVSETSGFLYVDERETLGHYLEYVWSPGPGRLEELTPHFPGRA